MPIKDPSIQQTACPYCGLPFEIAAVTFRLFESVCALFVCSGGGLALRKVAKKHEDNFGANCVARSEIVDFEMQDPKLNEGTAKDFLR